MCGSTSNTTKFITTGITRDVDLPTATIKHTDGIPIRGLFAEGGSFCFNYSSGSGLTTGTVLGQIAGTSARRLGHA